MCKSTKNVVRKAVKLSVLQSKVQRVFPSQRKNFDFLRNICRSCFKLACAQTIMPTTARPRGTIRWSDFKFFFFAPGVRRACARFAPGLRQVWRRWLSAPQLDVLKLACEGRVKSLILFCDILAMKNAPADTIAPPRTTTPQKRRYGHLAV